jgi:hypothetical protein
MKTVIITLCFAFLASSSFGQQVAKPVKDSYQEFIKPDVSSFDLATVVTPNPTIDKVAIMWYGQQEIDKILLIKSDKSEVIPVELNDEHVVVLNGLNPGVYYVQYYYKGKIMASKELIVNEHP